MQCTCALLGRSITTSRSSNKRQKLELERLNCLGHRTICFLVAWLLHPALMTYLHLQLLCQDTEDHRLIQHLTQATFSTRLPVILVSRMCMKVMSWCLAGDSHCYGLLCFRWWSVSIWTLSCKFWWSKLCFSWSWNISVSTTTRPSSPANPWSCSWSLEPVSDTRSKSVVIWKYSVLFFMHLNIFILDYNGPRAVSQHRLQVHGVWNQNQIHWRGGNLRNVKERDVRGSGRGNERGNVVVENGRSSVRENGENVREKRNSVSWRQSVRGNVSVKGRGKGNVRGKGKEGKRRGESWKDGN